MTARDVRHIALVLTPAAALAAWDFAAGTQLVAAAIRHLWWSVAVLGEAMKGWV